jgi:Flp pilus assembly protein TadD
MKMTRAHCLHRLGKYKEALAAYEGLLKTRPSDKEIRANFIASLMESGNYEKAQQLMTAK